MVQGNVATENTNNGIVMVGGSENKVVNNLLTNSRFSLGILLSGGNALNEVHANIVTGTPGTIGIFVNLGSTQNNIEGNTFLGNFLDTVDQSPDCDENQWRGNQFDTANQACIQ
jgi:parallel beta-helix repeat protein